MRVLAAELTARSEKSPDEVAVVDATGEHRLGEVMAAAASLAESLDTAMSGQPTVLVQADNSWRTLAAAVAIGLRGGLIAVISRHATASEFDMAWEDLRPDAVLADGRVLESWDIEPGAFPDSASALDGWTLLARGGTTGGVERWAGGSVVAMTSGSTGRPKCVVQSEEAIRYADRSTIEAVGLRPGDPVGALVPLSSVAAFCFGMYLPAMLGSPMIALDGWKPEAALELLETHEVRWTMLVPTMALQLSLVPGADGTLRSLTAMTVGGGPMDTGALGRAEDFLGTKILRVFGMSECLGHTTALPTESAEIRLGCDGRPFPGTEVRVVDEAGSQLGVGVVGHAQVKGPSLFVGYARDGHPERPAFTEDGFLPTGDFARINDNGTLNILGRDKQIIIRGGRNIDINEVEAAVARIPEVAQVCVVPVSDELLGERAAALVVTSGDAIGLPEVAAHLQAEGFPKFKWPEFVYVVSELPQNRVGKLSRQDAVAIAESLTQSPASA